MWVDLSGLGILILEGMFLPFLPGFFIALYLVNRILSIRSKEDRFYIKSDVKRSLIALAAAFYAAFITPLSFLILKAYMDLGRELSRVELLFFDSSCFCPGFSNNKSQPFCKS